MENPKNTRRTNKQEKQRMAIGLGGGRGGVGIGGVVMWGGVVAVATFVSVSAINFSKKRLKNKNHHPSPPPPIPTTTDVSTELDLNKNSNDDQGKGPLALLQDDSSPPIDYHPSKDGTTEMSPTQIDSTSLDSNKSLILDDNSVLDISEQNEKPTYLDVLLGDNLKPKTSSIPLTDNGTNNQEESLPMSEKKAIEAPHADHFEKEERPQLQLIGRGGGEEEEEEEREIGENIVEIVEEVTEPVQVMKEDEALEALDSPQIEAERNPQIQLVGKEEDDDGKNIAELVKEVIEISQEDQFEVEVDLEAIEVTKEHEAIGALDSPQIEAEQNPQMQLTEKERGGEEQEDDGENIVEIVKEVNETSQDGQFAVEIDAEANEVMNEIEAIGALDLAQIDEHDNPQTQLMEEEEGELEDGGNVKEKDDEADERTEDDPQRQMIGKGEEEEEERDNRENIVETVSVEKGQFANEDIKEDEAIEALDSPQNEAKENPQMQLIEQELVFDGGEKDMEEIEITEDNPVLRLSEDVDNDEDDDEDDGDAEEIAEKGEESSEGTGDSSMESNAEAIWPAESIEELSLQFKNSEINNQKLEEKIDGWYDSVKNGGIYGNGNHKNEDTVKSRISSVKEILTRIKVSMDSSNMGMWIWSAAVLLLVVVAPLLLSPANVLKLCIVVFLLLVLSRV